MNVTLVTAWLAHLMAMMLLPAISVGSVEPGTANHGGDADLSQMRDITDIERIAVPDERPALVPWIVVCATVGGGLGLWTARRLAAAPSRQPKPAETALTELAALQLKRAEEIGMEKYYRDLTDLLRNYLASAYGVPLAHQTSEELVEQMRPRLSERHGKMLGEILRHCDLAKFAQATWSSEDVDRTGQMAEQLIRETAASVGSPIAGAAHDTSQTKAGRVG